MSPETHAKAVRTRVARRSERIGELEHLVAGGTPAGEAALRAGWPTVAAAARALQRVRHPLAVTLERARKDAA
jgi:hypothetical protein